VIKTIFTTAIIIAFLNAIGHAGMAAWRHFQVRDQAELEHQIAQIAEEFEVPVAPEDIVVSRLGARTIAEAYYTMPIELFPRFFYPVDLSFTVESFAVTGVAPPARRPSTSP
jgi:hypothetical protein